MASGLRVEAVLEKYPRVETVQTEPEEPTEPPDVQVTSIYWTENPGRIQRANLDGSNIQDLITTGPYDPYGIVLGTR